VLSLVLLSTFVGEETSCSLHTPGRLNGRGSLMSKQYSSTLLIRIGFNALSAGTDGGTYRSMIIYQMVSAKNLFSKAIYSKL
jgi:hypothetical protein